MSRFAIQFLIHLFPDGQIQIDREERLNLYEISMTHSSSERADQSDIDIVCSGEHVVNAIFPYVHVL